MRYPEFLKPMFDGAEDASRASSAPSNIFFCVDVAAIPSHQHKKGVKAPAGRLDTSGFARKELFFQNSGITHVKKIIPHDTLGEMVVQVRPPSTVLSRDEVLDVVELIAQPTLSVTKSSW